MAVPFIRSFTCAVGIVLGATSVLPVQAQGLAGSYLAGRAASYEGDFSAVARYFTAALARDPGNPNLMENVVFAKLAMGQLDGAQPIAQQIWETGYSSQIASIAMVASAAKAGDYAAILAREPDVHSIGDLIDGLLTAWAHLGEGSLSKAQAALDALGTDPSLKFFVDYHRALALASVGDYEGSAALFGADDSRLARASRRAAIAYVQVLSQLDRNADALDFMTESFGTRFDPGLTVMADRLGAEETLAFDIAPTPLDGMAEAFFSISAVLTGEASDDYALMYARTAAALRPDHVDALLLSADLLDQLGRYALSIEVYKAVARDNPAYHAAELGRAEALRRAAKPDAAVEVLNNLAAEFPTEPTVFAALGDLLNQQEDYSAAAKAYDTALEHMDADAGGRWHLLYSRGIAHERLGNWPLAEADFRASLALNPTSPSVLNYLGYSMVEKQINLDEALDMIERAVAAQPNSGYIVDSLGWVLYRLGRYDEAVTHMERAVELMAVDPVVNDHLGDVYWAVGRLREAEFQWKRALSFISDGEGDGEADPDRIRRKLEMGLDAVLAEEGAPPLKVANEG